MGRAASRASRNLRALRRTAKILDKDAENSGEMSWNLYRGKNLRDILWDSSFHLSIESSVSGKDKGIGWKDERFGGAVKTGVHSV